LLSEKTSTSDTISSAARAIKTIKMTLLQPPLELAAEPRKITLPTNANADVAEVAR